MESTRLTQAGLINSIGGSDYNFRDKQGEIAVHGDLLRLTHTVSDQVTGIVYAQQVHEDQVTYVTSQSGDDLIQRIEESDGLMTDEVGLALVIKFADCTPIVIFDPVKRVQATVHSGWRSTVKEISALAIKQMQDQFHSNLEDLIVYIGPTIDQKHYQVGSEVYDAFAQVGERQRYFQPAEEADKYYLNMLEANMYILEKTGIHPDQIEYTDEFTYTSDRLHSARRDQPDYGLNAMVTIIAPSPNN